MMPLSVLALLVKLTAGGAGLAVLEMVSAKMRIFRVPEFLGVAFMLAVLGMLIHFLLEV
jgi:formate hydrogenlyase subunit 4